MCGKISGRFVVASGVIDTGVAKSAGITAH